MISIDNYAYASKLKQNDPMEKLFFTVLTLSVCLWANQIFISIAILIMMSWVTIRLGRTPLSLFLKLMLVPMSFLMIGVITIVFGFSSNALNFIFSIKLWGVYIGISKTGILTAANLFFRALGAVSCLYFLSLNTPMVDILAALRKLKCPKLMVELMGLIYRFIFVLLETANTMYIAQNSRLGYNTLAMRYRSLGTLASSLFIRAYKRSDDLYTALEARGYEGDLNVLETPFKKNWMGYATPVIINLFLILATLFFRKSIGGLH
jgi:cobalt/nickel transport system permease protein